MRHWPESFILDVKGKPFILLKIILFFLKTLHQNQKGQIIQQGDFITAVLVNLGGFSFMEPPLTVNGDPQPLMASASFLFVLKIKAALLQNFRARPPPLSHAWAMLERKRIFLGGLPLCSHCSMTSCNVKESDVKLLEAQYWTTSHDACLDVCAEHSNGDWVYVYGIKYTSVWARCVHF